MGLSMRQQRSLRSIEESLRRSDPRFATTMCAFAVFVEDGPTPEQERLTSRPLWRRIVNWVLTHGPNWT